MASFTFQIKLMVSRSIAIVSEQQVLELARPSENTVITLESLIDKSIQQASFLRVKGTGYHSEEAAFEAGQTWLRVLMLTLARVRMGTDFSRAKPSAAFIPANYPSASYEGVKEIPERQLVDTTYGIVVYDADKLTRFAGTGSAIHAIHSVLGENLVRLANNIKERFPTINLKEEIAFELFNASFFEVSTRTRFLLLVMAIEALIELTPQSDQAIKHVEFLMLQTKNSLTLSASEKASFTGSLRYMLNKSIGKRGRDYVAQRLGDRQYQGKQAENFFTYCYSLRSELVHEGQTEAGINMKALVYILEGFVSDLLCANILDIPK